MSEPLWNHLVIRRVVSNWRITPLVIIYNILLF